MAKKTYDVQINFYVKGAVLTVQTANFKNVTTIHSDDNTMTYVRFADGASFVIPTESIVSYTMAPSAEPEETGDLFAASEDA